MSADDAGLVHVLDLEQLRALGQRYARAVDARDYDALASLFHPDAIVDGLRGTAGITEYLATLRDTPASYERSMHVLGDPLIGFAPGAGRASLDTYAVVYQVGSLREGGADMTLGMRYLDEVEKRDGVWRILHRRTAMLWSRT